MKMSEDASEYARERATDFILWLKQRRFEAEAVWRELPVEDDGGTPGVHDAAERVFQANQGRKAANEQFFRDFLATHSGTQVSFTCAQLQHATGIRPTSAARLLQAATARGQVLRVVGANNRAIYRLPGGRDGQNAACTHDRG